MTLINAATDAIVFVVDDDAATRRSVARLIRSVGFAVKTFASPAAFLRQELPAGPACVLLDMCMEGMTGLEVQDALRRNDRRVPVVFLSGRSTILTAVASVRHGAQDFLEKPFRPEELIEAVSRALQNDRAGSAERATRAEFQRRFDTLTTREQEVMALVVSGLLNKQSAAELGITEKTIKVHRARVMEKMNVESLAELVLIAERIGLTARPAVAAGSSRPKEPHTTTSATRQRLGLDYADTEAGGASLPAAVTTSQVLFAAGAAT